MTYNIHYEVCATIILLVLIIMFLSRKRYTYKSDYAFFVLLFVAFFSTSSNLLTVVTIEHSQQIPVWFNYLLNMFHYYTTNACVFIYLIYLYFHIKKSAPFTKTELAIVSTLAVTDIVLISATPHTKWIFYFDEQKNYQSGEYKWLLFVISSIVLMICLIETAINRKVLSTIQKVLVCIFTVLNVSAVFIQLLNPELMVIGFAVATALMLIYITLANPDNYIDKLTGIYNATAFRETMKSYIYRENEFSVISVRMEDFHRVNKSMGTEKGDALLTEIAKKLKAISKKIEVFRTTGMRFDVIIHYGNGDIYELGAEIENILKNGLEINGIPIILEYKMCYTKFPEIFADIQEFEHITQYLFSHMNTEETCIEEATLDTRAKVRREQEIYNLLKYGIEQGAFNVYYQPIMDARTGTFRSAEALLRLKHEKLGFIAPDEFIPMAEKNGSIIPIGEFVFEEVCKFLSTVSEEEYGLSYVEINLSTVQCMQRDLKERFAGIMRLYNVPARRVNLELTETAAIYSRDLLKLLMESFEDVGVRFMLDDYGTGFASLDYLIQYPFSVVKLDRELVWAMSEGKGLVALEHTVKMIKELRLEIIAEGVETKEQSECLKELGCDYLQGYYYAKPMPKEDFIAFIKEHR